MYYGDLVNQPGPLGGRQTPYGVANNRALSRVFVETVSRTSGRIIRSVRALSC